MLQVVGHGRDAAEQIIVIWRSNSNLVCRPLKCASKKGTINILTTSTCGQDNREATHKASDWLRVTTVTIVSILDSNQRKWAYILSTVDQKLKCI